MQTLPVGIFNECPAIQSVNLPEAMSEIGGFAFKDCTWLNSITLPSNITTIGQGAFQGCTGLVEVDLSNTKIISVSNGLFSGLSNLKSVSLPDTVTLIDYNAFQNSGLTSICLPANVNTIRGAAFDGCTNLTAIVVYAEPLTPQAGESTEGGGDYWQRPASQCFKNIGENSVVYFVGDELPLAFTSSYVANRIDLSKTVIAVTGGGTFPEGTVFEASKLPSLKRRVPFFTGMGRQ